MQTITKQLTARGFSPFDALVWLVCACLIAAIAITVLLGDRVGVRVVRMEPTTAAHSTEPIVVQFGEAMARESVEERLRIEPPISGELIWNASTLIFEPAAPLQPGSDYTVTVAAGAESQNGRLLLDDMRFTFDVRTPRVAYLAPATSFPQNVWIADPLNPDEARQVTHSPTGLFDFSVSPDGTQIAFSEYDDQATDINIKLLDIASGTVQQITNCQDATCTNPVWRPDGQTIAYHRLDANTSIAGIGPSITRIWLVDVTGTVFNNRPLFDDFQIVGHSPTWSGDGQRIAIYDPTAPGILVRDLNDQSIAMIPSLNGTMGTLSPDGTQLVFPNIDAGMTSPIRNFLQVADLTSNEVNQLTTLDDAIDDTMAAWHPNGRDLAIARRYVDERFTRGPQIYLLDSETGEAEPLVVDPAYVNGFFSWSPTGDQIVLQRFQTLDAQGNPTQNARTEVWVYNRTTDALVRVAVDAFLPHWVP